LAGLFALGPYGRLFYNRNAAQTVEEHEPMAAQVRLYWWAG
jgi:hypothetical protein